MLRSLLSMTVLGLALGVSAGAEVKFPITGENTKLEFVGTKPGGKHVGGFKKLHGAATVTDGKLDTLKIEVDIDVASLHSDDAKLTGHLLSPDFFNVKEHPKAVFKSTKVEKGEKGVYTVTGELTMLGKSKVVSFPASINATPDALLLSSEFPINRTDWGMTFGKDKIDENVNLKIAMTAKK
jgi:polyisoprenoid-binding protein YceI